MSADTMAETSGHLTDTDLRNLFAAFVLAGMDATKLVQDKRHLTDRARLAWRMADAMMATQYEFTAFSKDGVARSIEP